MILKGRMKFLLFTFALFLITASASACPNLSGHYVLAFTIQ
jgi:hypothetical protein